MPVTILIEENGTIDAVVAAEQVQVEIIASMRRKGDIIRLDGLHLQRLSMEPLSRSAIDRLCGEFCRFYGIRKLVVQGARRTTGRSVGEIPNEVVFEVKD